MMSLDLYDSIKIGFIALFIWLFVMTILFFLTYFRVIDIQTIVEGMKQCVITLNTLS